LGADFATHKIFIDKKETIIEMDKLKNIIKEIMLEEGLESANNEEEANRSFIIIPEGKWLHLGDSAGTMGYENGNGDDFNKFSEKISKFYPVIDIHMSDSAAVHFYQYSEEKLIDKFGDKNFPFFAFENIDEAKPYEGVIDLWKKFLIKPENNNELRNTWEQRISGIDKERIDANKILDNTAKLFGWEEPLYCTGYSNDYEGIPEKYDKFLGYYDKNFDYLEEMHFKYINQNENATKTADLFWDDD
jgi:hypothetical protein